MVYKTIALSKQSCSLFLLALIVLGAGIWSPGVITQGDESDYITSSREMFKSGDLLTPTLRDEARFTKPPLLYWLINFSYHLFGVSLFSSRLPSVISGVLLAMGVSRFGTYLFGREAGTLSALLTISSFGIVKFSKIALMEIPLTLFILLTFYCYLTYLDSGHKSRLWLSALFLGFVSLLKSPAYAVICVLVIGLYLITKSSPVFVFRKEYRWAVIIFLAVTLPWYLLMFLKHGDLFYLYYLNEHIDKFLAKRHYLLRVWAGLFFYLLPWSFLFLYSLYRVIADREYLNRKNSFLLLWLGVFLIIFLFPNQKSHYYSIPMIPPAMLLTGSVLSRAAGNGIRPFKVITAVIIAILIFIMTGAIIILNHSSGWFYIITILPLFSSLLFTIKGTFKKSAVLFGISAALFYSLVLPTLSTSPIPEPAVLKLKRAEKPVFTFRLSPVLYSDRLGIQVREVRDYKDLLDLPFSGGGALVIREADYEKIRGTGTTLSTWKRWRRRIPAMECLKAFITGNGEILKERVLLVELKSVLNRQGVIKFL